jgi:hypothetical protein
MSDSMPDQASQETARLVPQMDAAISAFRAGQSSGIHALDAASQIVSDASSDNAMDERVRHTPRDVDRHVPRRPDRVELAVLTALAARFTQHLNDALPIHHEHAANGLAGYA